MAATRRRNTAGPIIVIALAVIAAVHCAGDDEVVPTDAVDGSASSAAESYARAAGNDSWPTLAEGARPEVAPEAISAVNYYVVLDGSGSMLASECSGDATKIEAAVTALQRFVDAVPAEANLGLAAFDESGTSERVPLGSGNREAFRAALAAVVADSGTPLRSAIELGYRQLTEQARRQLGYGEYHLVVVTDGVPDPSSEDPTSAIRTIWAESPVVLHTIGFCIGTDHVLNQPGRSYYVAAETPEQLQQGLGSVLAEAPSFDVSRFGN
jgi:Mg-chelatase subunit ChlD